jgi:hypothetical protein
MMRCYLALAILACCATPAAAGLRATYSDAEGSRKLVIDVADNGDARIGDKASDDYGLFVGGHFYMVSRDDKGPTVARIEDVAAAIDQVMPPVFKDIFTKAAASAKPGKLRLEAKGERSLAGRAGKLWLVYGMDEKDPAKPTEFVISEDPALKPVGRAMEQFMNAAVVPAAVFIGPAAAEIVAETHQIFALGTPLDAGGRFKLEAVETVDVPAEALKLPGKLKTVDEIVAAMKAGATAR